MTIIEGIGDEVIHFFILLSIILVIVIAWCSTYISERPLLRTVVILERHTTRHTIPDNQGTLDLRDADEVTAETNEPEQENKSSQSVSESNNQLEMNVVEHSSFLVNADEIQSTIRNLNETSNPTNPEESDGGTGDSNITNKSEVVRNRRIAFFQNKEDSPKDQSESKEQDGKGDKTSMPNECEAHSSNDENIRIRLKYLNDDLKLVEGRLHEQLGDFKRRHFSIELAGRKLVRLIFNGKVLQQDTKTLQNYGLFDNCVVHCLVHHPRTPPPSPNLNRRQAQNVNNLWDLGNIFVAALSVILCLAWYSRYQYAHLYTATSTVALIGLTGMFTISLIGIYMPNADAVRTQ